MTFPGITPRGVIQKSPGQEPLYFRSISRARPSAWRAWSARRLCSGFPGSRKASPSWVRVLAFLQAPLALAGLASAAPGNRSISPGRCRLRTGHASRMHLGYQ